MNIDSIVNGAVIDHITAGRGMRLYELLHLEQVDCPVAIIKNVNSRKLGKKDIIKVDAAIVLNFDVIGYVDPGVTVNIIKDGKLIEKKTIDKPERLVNVIRDGKLVEKKRIEMPESLTNVIRCRNPRCITSTEQELDHIFKLTDRENSV